MACLLSAPCCEVERAPGRDVFQMLERAVDAPAEMCCRHMVLHQMGDELDGPSPIYPCDGEAATGDSFGGLEGDELTIAHPRDIGAVTSAIPTPRWYRRSASIGNREHGW